MGNALMESQIESSEDKVRNPITNQEKDDHSSALLKEEEPGSDFEGLFNEDN